MYIETIDNIVNMLADKLGVYGACKSIDPDGCECNEFMCCRVGFALVLTERIYKAIENEKRFGKLLNKQDEKETTD